MNGRRCDIAQKLAVGDVLELYLPTNSLRTRCCPFLRLRPEVNIVYEDENLLLADKPPGLLVHEDEGGEADALIRRNQHYLYQKGEYDPARENGFAPALCNRIDRGTGGIVIAAKNFATLQMMSEKIRLREVAKLYYALYTACPSPGRPP